MAKLDEALDLFDKIAKRDGWWACKYCSNDNWTVRHKRDDVTCDKTGKLRKDAEIIDNE